MECPVANGVPVFTGILIGAGDIRPRWLQVGVPAQKAKDPHVKETYLGLMHGWRELADEIERFEHTWLDREGL